MKIVIRWLVSAISLIIVAYFIPGISFSSFWVVLFTALVLGIINAVIRPIILVLTLPINILTLGLFTFIVNALMFWLVYLIVPGFSIANFSVAIWGALIYAIINWAINLIFTEDKNK
jgi:putative membrane protein